jgi:inosine-uridine nucleoside N-ribohydrolase
MHPVSPAPLLSLWPCLRRVIPLGALIALLLPLPALADPRLVIIDQDASGPATSDEQSILMLIQSPDVKVLGITVLSGDAWRDEEMAHTLRLLEIIGRTDIPVVPGAVYPLVNSQEATKRWESLYGKLVYKGAWNEPSHAPDFIPPLPEGSPTTKPLAEDAAHFLIRQVHRYPGEVSIIAAGPMTDIALAAKLDDKFASLAKELVIMGGSLEPQDNGTSFAQEYIYTPRLEFNFRWDPEAAHIVFHQPWKKLVQVPVDPTTKAYFSEDLKKQIGQSSTPVAKYVFKYCQIFPMWDELASAVWLDPSIITKGETMLIDVDTSFTAGYGDTLSWHPGRGPGLGEQPTQEVREIDVPKFDALFVRLMQAPTPKPSAP